MDEVQGSPGRTEPCTTICGQGSVWCCGVAGLKSKDNNVQASRKQEYRVATIQCTRRLRCVLQRNCEVVERVQNGESHSLQLRLTTAAPGKAHTGHATNDVPCGYSSTSPGHGSCVDRGRFCSTLHRLFRAHWTASCAVCVSPAYGTNCGRTQSRNSTHSRLPMATTACGIGVAAQRNIAALSLKLSFPRHPSTNISPRITQSGRRSGST